MRQLCALIPFNFSPSLSLFLFPHCQKKKQSERRFLRVWESVKESMQTRETNHSSQMSNEWNENTLRVIAAFRFGCTIRGPRGRRGRARRRCSLPPGRGSRTRRKCCSDGRCAAIRSRRWLRRAQDDPTCCLARHFPTRGAASLARCSGARGSWLARIGLSGAEKGEGTDWEDDREWGEEVSLINGFKFWSLIFAGSGSRWTAAWSTSTGKSTTRVWSQGIRYPVSIDFSLRNYFFHLGIPSKVTRIVREKCCVYARYHARKREGSYDSLNSTCYLIGQTVLESVRRGES